MLREERAGQACPPPELPAGTDETLLADYTADPAPGPAAAVPAPAATGAP
jgi:hypothetical protein